jgi:hypothetical protein
MAFRLVHEQNAMSWISVSLEPPSNVNSQRLVHKAKAFRPIDATEAGTQKDWSPWHISKTRGSINSRDATEFDVTKGIAFREASRLEDLNFCWDFDGGIKAEVVKKLGFIDVHEKMPEEAKMTVSRLDLERADA